MRFTRQSRVQTPQSSPHVSVAEPANATVEPCQRHETTTPTRHAVGVGDGTTTPTAHSVGVAGSQHDDPLALHESAAGWVAREREARARAGGAREREGCPDDPRVYVSPHRATLQAIARRAEEAHAQDAAAGVEVAAPFPPMTRTAPAASAEPPPPPRSRKDRIKRELAAIHLEERIARRAAAKASTRVVLDDAAVWGPRREKRIVEARAKVRPIMEHVPKARDRYRLLALDPATAHFAIALKRICDEHGWTLADQCARRLLTLIEFMREFARPQCWNAHRARAPLARGLGSFGAVLAHAKRKYSLCATAVAQPFLAGVIASAGDGPTDDRSVHRKTVGRLTALLEDAGVIQAVQVPAHAAESYEVGKSGHAIYRYWLADKGSPKPALMRPWTVDGELVDAAILEAPWRGAVVALPPATAPP